MLSEMTYDDSLPVPIGVLYKENKPTYESMLAKQIEKAKNISKNDLQAMIAGPNTWQVK